MSLGTTVKDILESTSGWVSGSQAVYVDVAGNTYTFKCIRADSLSTVRREGVDVTEAGTLDRDSKRLLFLTKNIRAAGLSRFDPAGYFLLGGVRYDFEERQPTLEDLTPLDDALEVFTLCFLRRVEEPMHQVEVNTTGNIFQFDSWSE